MKLSKQVCSFSLLLLLVIAIVEVPDSVDQAHAATNQPYRRSDNPVLWLSPDMFNWPAAVPPESAVEGGEGDLDATDVEVFDFRSGTVTRISSSDTSQPTDVSTSTSTPPFQGLLALATGGVASQDVHGFDDRVRITATADFPWSTIVKLFVTAQDQSEFGCSGALVALPGRGFHVLTAGHCVYLHHNGGWPSSIKVVPGLDEGYMPYNYALATHLRLYEGWVNHEYKIHDWAVLTLDRNVGDFAGWMGRMTDTISSSIYYGNLHLAGYPGDLDCSGHPNTSGLCMYFDADTGVRGMVYEYRNAYKMDAAPGQSGAPVWRLEGSDRLILSIHAYGGGKYNWGTRLNRDKFDAITSWFKEDLERTPADYPDLIDDGEAYSGFDPVSLGIGSDFRVWSGIRNIGTAPSGSFEVAYYASTDDVITSSDYPIGTVTVTSIDPFSYTDVSWSGKFPSSIPSGTYWIGWIIDPGNSVYEFDEDNNAAHKSSYQLTSASYTVTFFTNPSDPSGTICADDDLFTNAMSAVYAADQRVYVWAIAPPGYFWSHWMTSGGVTVDDPSLVGTYMTVSGDGWLNAIFTEPIITVSFETNPRFFLESPGTIVFADRSYVDGEAGSFYGGTYEATAYAPTDYKFDHWGSGGVLLRVGPGEYPETKVILPTGMVGSGWLKATFSAKVTFYTNPSNVGSITWGYLQTITETHTNGDFIYDNRLPPEHATSTIPAYAWAPPTDYVFKGWTCTGGLSCAGTRNYIDVVFIGPGTITANFEYLKTVTVKSVQLTRYHRSLQLPFPGVTVTVDHENYVTPFSLRLQSGTYRLTAPSIVTMENGQKYVFLEWRDETGARVSRQTTFNFNVKESNKIFIAVYYAV